MYDKSILLMKLVILLLFIFVDSTSPHILKLPECHKFDAIFSKIKYNKKLNGTILQTFDLTRFGADSLRRCLRDCTIHPKCWSVNYMRQNSTCELLESVYQSCTDEATWLDAIGWNHFETDHLLKTVSSTFKVCSR